MFLGLGFVFCLGSVFAGLCFSLSCAKGVGGVCDKLERGLWVWLRSVIELCSANACGPSLGWKGVNDSFSLLVSAGC